mmetsp:Transcript_46832/g.139803  ORF Transcript_46832/g.139803 Transcript_46832/m.139803 type:complete len:344 (-) Transcript_46832:816-1847(-)
MFSLGRGRLHLLCAMHGGIRPGLGLLVAGAAPARLCFGILCLLLLCLRLLHRLASLRRLHVGPLDCGLGLRLELVGTRLLLLRLPHLLGGNLLRRLGAHHLCVSSLQGLERLGPSNVRLGPLPVNRALLGNEVFLLGCIPGLLLLRDALVGLGLLHLLVGPGKSSRSSGILLLCLAGDVLPELLRCQLVRLRHAHLVVSPGFGTGGIRLLLLRRLLLSLGLLHLMSSLRLGSHRLSLLSLGGLGHLCLLAGVLGALLLRRTLLSGCLLHLAPRRSLRSCGLGDLLLRGGPDGSLLFLRSLLFGLSLPCRMRGSGRRSSCLGLLALGLRHGLLHLPGVGSLLLC